MMSRANPVSRDTSVKPPTVKMRPIIGRVASPVIVRALPASVEPIAHHDADDSAMEFIGCPRFRPWQPQAGKRYSGSEGASARRDDPVLRRLVEIGVHRQAGHLARPPRPH